MVFRIRMAVYQYMAPADHPCQLQTNDRHQRLKATFSKALCYLNVRGLKDGVLSCFLANPVDPGVVEKVVNDPHHIGLHEVKGYRKLTAATQTLRIKGNDQN